jgi:hypothetical protein
MDFDTKLLVIKYAAEGLTALYGLYATVSDFHETRNGKRILSWRGYLGIAFLVFATFLTIFNERERDLRENAKNAQTVLMQQQQLESELAMNTSLERQRELLEKQRQDLTATLTQMHETASATSAVLNESRRTSDPLEQIVAININLSLPTESKAVQPYLERLKAGGVDLREPFIFPPKTLGFPDPQNGDEAVLFNIATPVETTVELDAQRGSLAWIGNCNPDYFRANLEGDKLYLECYVTQVAVKGASGQLRSHLDLNGAWVSVEIGPSILLPAHPDYSKYSGPDVRELPLTVDVTFYEKGGKEIDVQGFKRSFGATSFFKAKILPGYLSRSGYGLPIPSSVSASQQPAPVSRP